MRARSSAHADTEEHAEDRDADRDGPDHDVDRGVPGERGGGADEADGTDPAGLLPAHHAERAHHHLPHPADGREAHQQRDPDDGRGRGRERGPEAGTGAEAVEPARTLRPDVVPMDMRIPGLDGLEATRALVRDAAPPRIVVVTTFDLDEYVYGALRAGACGFLLKDAGPRLLVEAVRAVARGRTDAERATELFVSLSTVKTHLTNIQAKLDVRNRTEIAVWAWESGLVR